MNLAARGTAHSVSSMTGDESVLARAAALLEAFDDEHRELTLAALVGRSGLPRSTAHRMAAQMVALGWLDKPGGRYRIGNRLFALSGLVPVRHTLREAVLPFLQDLYEATRTTVQLGVLDHDRVLIVEKITGHRRMPMLTQVGGQIPAYCSSLGRAILAHTDGVAVDAVLAGELPARTGHTLTDPDAIREEIAAVRKHGYAFDREEGNAGVSCIGAPIFGPLGEIVAALSVLDDAVRGRLLDTRDNFLLYRQILPLGVPGLYFNGYNSSFFSPLNAEMAAVWIAADMAGTVPLPDPEEMRRAVFAQLAFMDEATNGHHCHGGKIIPSRCTAWTRCSTTSI